MASLHCVNAKVVIAMWGAVTVVSVALALTEGRGLLLLYRPKDISNDCVFSHHLRYDLSFGNGLSDTITLVFRTLNKIDYECGVEIVTDPKDVYLLIVILFPNNVGENCPVNGDAFTVMKKDKCLRICDVTGDRDLDTPYFIISVKSRIRFQFLSNSSINSDMDANMYQVTATSARMKPRKGCDRKNETVCVIKGDEYCFTSGVVCDGIKNCGVADWFDERKSECEMPVERIGPAPVAAVVAVFLCLALAGGHLLERCLPPRAHSFFIFNANEDNRLCIDPVFTAPHYNSSDFLRSKRVSIIPVSTSSSEEEKPSEDPTTVGILPQLAIPSQEVENKTEKEDEKKESDGEAKSGHRRKTAMRAMTALIQERLRAVAGARRSQPPPALPFL